MPELAASPASFATAWPPGWGTPLSAAICESCDWQYLVPAGQTLPVCPACRRSNLAATASYPETPRQPELIAPFTVSDGDAAAALQRFARWRPFTPRDLRAATLQGRLQKLYLPRWLVDGDVQAEWQADAGFNYQVVSHQDRFDETKGDWQSEQLTETRVRWEPRMGRLRRHYDNVTAPAIEEDGAVQKAIGDYDLQLALSFDAAALADALVRLPNRSVEDAWPDALPRFQALAADECRVASRADHMREFAWNPHFEQQQWTQLLLPVYTTFYQDDAGIEHPILVHGQTGQVAGRRQASMRSARRLSIVLGLAAVAVFSVSILLVMLSALGSVQDTPSGGALWATLGVFGVWSAMGLGILAMAPVVYVWVFNRTPSVPSWVDPA